MSTSRTRVIGTAVAGSAAAAMLLSPALAHADGTKNPKYSQPPSKSKPKNDDDGAAPLNNKRAPIKHCGQGWENGGYNQDPSYYPFELAAGTTSVTLDYNAYSYPDKFDVMANGKVLKSTGWRGEGGSYNEHNHPLQGSGKGDLTVALPANTSKIEIRVTTDISNTEWRFDVSCVK
ncbi:MAG: hypothetical protein QM658_08480 [Gordonia sp. (in: high G+C Gram-positive bacteria)]